jgi:iron complex outermembrane receptor protein
LNPNKGSIGYVFGFPQSPGWSQSFGLFGQAAYSLNDLSLTYNAPKSAWYVQGFVKNLEDNIIVTSLSVSVPNGTASISDPRTYGVRFGAKF